MYEDLELNEVQIISPTQPHTASVIFIHGLGQSNLTWMVMIREAIAPSLPHVKWLLPQAPHMPITLNQGHPRSSWFDIRRLPPTDDEFAERASQLNESMVNIENLILTQVHSGIDSRRIILAGFSQGATLALMTGLSSLHDLGGVISLSGWIPHRFRETLTATCSGHIPLLWCHGDLDDEIPWKIGQDSITFLRSVGITTECRLYSGLKHSINDQEVIDIREWLIKVLPMGDIPRRGRIF